ncbi:hypothetical protein [Anaerofustis butyriciformans]|uniref:hypothetical protein n=1 Tax=Anaerofustis butyriciformans TaxID=3108533 RepID=UPI002E30E865|nr:hypothetical protein [Anaerofustis sp. HA2171]
MESKAKGATLLKVTSIIILIIGIIALAFNVLGLFGIIALDLLTIFYIVWAFIYPITWILTGLKGKKNANSTDEKDIKDCFKWGIILILVIILDYGIGYIINGLYGVSVFSLIRFIFPILYLVGVNQNKKSIDSNDFNN